MQKPLISVVMCTYNGEKYIQKQLESLVTQTYDHLEIVIVDDCSTDNTFMIISKFTQKFDFITSYQNQVNIGFNKNFEKALGYSTGDLIAISDQDDIWFPNKLARLQENIGSKAMIFSNSKLIDETDLVVKGLLLNQPDFRRLSYRSILLNNFVSGHTTLFTRNLVEHVLPFPETGFYDWWMGFVASYNNSLVYLNETLTAYRIHPDSLIQKDLLSASTERIPHCLMNYKLTNSQLNNFRQYLEERHDCWFVDNLRLLHSKGLNLLQRTYMLIFLYLNYNRLFPLHRARKLISKSRFSFVKRYLSQVEVAKGLIHQDI